MDRDQSMDGFKMMRVVSVIIFMMAVGLAVLIGGLFIAIGTFYAVCSAIMFLVSGKRGQQIIQRAASHANEQDQQRLNQKRTDPKRPDQATPPVTGKRLDGFTAQDRRPRTDHPPQGGTGGHLQPPPRRRALPAGHQGPHGPSCRCNLQQHRQGDIQPRGQ